MVDSDKLFFKVWRNIYLKKIIFHHLKLYNYINNYLNDFYSIDSIFEFRRNFQPKGYLNSLVLNISDILNGNGIYDDHSELFDGILFDQFLPKDITTLTIKYTRDTISLGLDEPRIQLELPPLPDQITKLNIFTMQMEYYQNIDNTKPLDISEWPLKPNYLMGKVNLRKLNFKKIPNIDYNKINPPLYISNSFNKIATISIGQIPMGIIDLRLPDNFNGNLESGCIPSTVLKLKFGRAYDKPLNKSTNLPIGLIELTYHANHSIPLNCLPETLEILKLGENYNSPIIIGSLPKSLKSLKFGKSFNQPLKQIGCFPLNENLNTLILGKNWDNIVSNGVLPSSTLIHLNLGKASDFRLKQTIYSSSINMFSKFYSDESLIQCNNLKTLIINNFDKQILPNSLPNSIVTIKFKNFNNANKPIQPFSLPSELEYIDFGNKFNQKIQPNSFSHLKNLKIIKFGKSFNQPLENCIIPSTVNLIIFKNSKFNKSPPSPTTTTTLKLKIRMYNSNDLSNDFKNCLNSIDCKFLSNEDESNLNSTTFTNSLTSLKIRDEFRKPTSYNGFLKNKINLTNLDINEPIEKLELPLLNNINNNNTTTTTQNNNIINNNIKILTLHRGIHPLLIFPSIEILIIKTSYIIIDEKQFPNLKEIHSKNHKFINSIFNNPKLFEILKYPIKNKNQKLDERASTILL
ncbi:hypothetical protein ACTFIW_007001 [Dictyostelium discoideum]